MQQYISALVKSKLNILLTTDKQPYLGTYRQRLAGKVLAVIFDKRTTTFEVSDYVKTSKKLRSNTIDIQIKDIFQYTFIGICIAHKKDPFTINTSFLMRNTFDRFPYELTVNLYSPLVEDIDVLYHIQKLLYITHSKYYYLRKKPMPLSTIYFNYVVDMLDHDILDEEDSDINADE
jgi:ribosomal protein L19